MPLFNPFRRRDPESAKLIEQLKREVKLQQVRAIQAEEEAARLRKVLGDVREFCERELRGREEHLNTEGVCNGNVSEETRGG